MIVFWKHQEQLTKVTWLPTLMHSRVWNLNESIIYSMILFVLVLCTQVNMSRIWTRWESNSRLIPLGVINSVLCLFLPQPRVFIFNQMLSFGEQTVFNFRNVDTCMKVKLHLVIVFICRNKTTIWYNEKNFKTLFSHCCNYRLITIVWHLHN
jgi:hypothetical protein